MAIRAPGVVERGADEGEQSEDTKRQDAQTQPFEPY